VNDGRLAAWLERYLEAWTTNDPATIGSLFTDDAVYRPTPFSDGWVGRAAIVTGWLDRQDEPGDWTFRHEVLCDAPTRGVVRGWTSYPRLSAEYSNVWLVELAADGRCREFVEWWVERGQRDPGDRTA
jgi:SnoaL-like domain